MRHLFKSQRRFGSLSWAVATLIVIIIAIPNNDVGRMYQSGKSTSLGVAAAAASKEQQGMASGTPHGQVVTLTESNFEDAISDPANGLWFLKFYAPWCGHCKQLAPVLERIAPYLKGKMAIGTIDCTIEKSLCNKFNIQGYPTLKIYRDGDYYMEYAGDRHPDAIITFGEKMAMDPINVTVSTIDQLKENVLAKSSNDVAFVAYDPNGKGDNIESILQSTAMLQVFKQAARKQQAHAHFALIAPDISPEELTKFGAGIAPFIALLEEDADAKIYNGELDTHALVDFVRESNHALITPLGSHNFRSIGVLGKRMIIAAIVVEDPANDKKSKKKGTAPNAGDNGKVKSMTIIKELHTFARYGPSDITSKYLFCTMDGVRWGRFLEQFSIQSSNLPQVFVLDYTTREYWQNSTVFTVEEFLKGVESGSIPVQKQEDGKMFGGQQNPFQQVVMVFKQYLPWSALILILMFIGTYFVCLSLREEEEEDIRTRAHQQGRATTKKANNADNSKSVTDDKKQVSEPKKEK